MQRQHARSWIVTAAHLVIKQHMREQQPVPVQVRMNLQINGRTCSEACEAGTTVACSSVQTAASSVPACRLLPASLGHPFAVDTKVQQH